jgi:hypoxanthine phosphoribosyltransferase
MSCSRIEVLYDMQTIHNRLVSLSHLLNEDYEGEEVVLLCVLKGATNFFVDLTRLLTFDVQYEFVGLSSYEGTESTGNVKLTTDLLTTELAGKRVIIVEDIVDTGRSIVYLKALIEDDVHDVKVCTLLDKPSRRIVDIKPDYTAFVIPDHFVVGYGLDYNQKYRNLPYIGIYNQWS